METQSFNYSHYSSYDFDNDDDIIVPQMIKPPSMIGRYKILNLIGKGSFAEVRAVIDTMADTNDNACLNNARKPPLCVKIISKSLLKEETEIEHQRREIQTLKEIGFHENIVQYYDFLEDNDFFYMFMEYLNGKSLLDLVNENGGIPNHLSLYIFKQLLNSLKYIHSLGIAHRDVKLENVIVDNMYRVKLIDFGFCSKRNNSENGNNSLLTTFCGSLLYTAPEIVIGQPYNGAQADMWSAGVILYSMVCGMLPWDDSNMPKAIEQIINCSFQVTENVSPICEDLIKKLLCYDPNLRFSANEAFDHPWLNPNLNYKKNQTNLKQSYSITVPTRGNVFSKSAAFPLPSSCLSSGVVGSPSSSSTGTTIKAKGFYTGKKNRPSYFDSSNTDNSDSGNINSNINPLFNSNINTNSNANISGSGGVRKVEWKGKCRSLALSTTLCSNVPQRRRRSSHAEAESIFNGEFSSDPFLLQERSMTQYSLLAGGDSFVEF